MSTSHGHSSDISSGDVSLRVLLPPARPIGRFFSGLEALGYRVGRNLVLKNRLADGKLDRLPALAAEFIAFKPHIVFTVGTQATLAMSRVTVTVAIASR